MSVWNVVANVETKAVDSKGHVVFTCRESQLRYVSGHEELLSGITDRPIELKIVSPGLISPGLRPNRVEFRNGYFGLEIIWQVGEEGWSTWENTLNSMVGSEYRLASITFDTPTGGDAEGRAALENFVSGREALYGSHPRLDVVARAIP